jgi:hypothetical protein
MQVTVCCNIVTLTKLCAFVGSKRINRIVMHEMENVKYQNVSKIMMM